MLSLIDSVRSSSLVVHSGLQAAAREHSRGMASRGGLDHDGAQQRVMGASPDPGEAGGAPDDGFDPYGWCENVTYVDYGTEAEAPRHIFEQWRRSARH
ncbi:MAG: CAP domain-containing protein, partial [Candidatus Binatia bacterium]